MIFSALLIHCNWTSYTFLTPFSDIWEPTGVILVRKRICIFKWHLAVLSFTLGIILVHDLTNKKSSQNLYRWSLEALNRDVTPTGVLVTNGWVKNIRAKLTVIPSSCRNLCSSLKLLGLQRKVDMVRLGRKKEMGNIKERWLFFFFYTANQAILTAHSLGRRDLALRGKDVYCILYLSEASLSVVPVPVNSRYLSVLRNYIVQDDVSGQRSIPSLQQDWGSSLHTFLVWVMEELF